MQRFGLGIFALSMYRSARLFRFSRHRVVRAEGLLPDGERPLVERFGLGVLALMVQICQIVQAFRDVRMVRAEGLLANGQRPLVERLGLGVFALMWYRIARLFRLAATSGWSGPRAFSRMASDRLCSGSASAYLP